MGHSLRSVLLPLNSKCSRQKECGYCKALGYRQKVKFFSHSDFAKKVTGSVVLPCSSIEAKSYSKKIETLQQNNFDLSHVFLADYYFANKDLVAKSKISRFAIVHTDHRYLNSLNETENNYFLITPQSVDYVLKSVDFISLSKSFKFFFLPHTVGDKNTFSADRQMQLAEELRRIDPFVEFELPFGHDALDSRLPDHLQWQDFNSVKRNFGTFFPVPSISIVIPFLNRSEFIRKIFAALQEQTLATKEFEVILVDDGSTKAQQEDLFSFLKTVQNIHVTYIFEKRLIPLDNTYRGNRAGPMRNIGVQNSRGDILLFLDSDIIIPKNYLELVLDSHKTQDVLLPKRMYLSEEATARSNLNYDQVNARDLMQPPWQFYIQQFYKNLNWAAEDLPWKFFITYCLSIKRELFHKAGGFRTNFIAFGYEDLDLGYRLWKLKPSVRLLDVPVYHLYHFQKGAEYTLNQGKRAFQLSLTSKMFITQNLPRNAEYLADMVSPKNRTQKIYEWVNQVQCKFASIRRAL